MLCRPVEYLEVVFSFSCSLKTKQNTLMHSFSGIKVKNLGNLYQIFQAQNREVVSTYHLVCRKSGILSLSSSGEWGGPPWHQNPVQKWPRATEQKPGQRWTKYMILRKSFRLPEPQFPHLWNGYWNCATEVFLLQVTLAPCRILFLSWYYFLGRWGWGWYCC